MKTLFSALAILALNTIIVAQTQPTLTINATGNRNKQVVVDSKYYTIDNNTTTDQQSVVISDLKPGQHTLSLVRNNQNNKTNQTSFTLRQGYDLTITVSANGSISSVETRTAKNGNAGTQLSSSAFTKLYNQTKAKTSSSTRSSYLQTQFTSLNKKMTSSQASQLIQLVNSESSRLKLAKQSYPMISDQANFSLVVNLLSSSANRAELNNYIASVPVNTDGSTTANEAAITDANFLAIYNEATAEPANERAFYLNNFFSRTFNYYTSAQAKQLIELLSDQQQRYDAAKNAYRGVTDRGNYSVVYPLLSSSNRSLLITYVNSFDTNYPQSAMTATNFDKLYQSVYYQNSASQRYNSIYTAFTTPGNYFTVTQAKKLIPLVSDEASRLKLAKASYTVLVDRTNYTQFNDFLSTTTSRTDLYNYVNNYNGTSAGIKVAMSDADFKKIYSNIQYTFGIGAKYSALTEIFNTETNYFTVSQAKQLIQQVSSESNRLELAKSSYNNITDPANFSQIYDLLSSQSSKNELMAYVNSNAYNN
jgi:hypothetical protein